MNKRTAKRIAYALAAADLRNAANTEIMMGEPEVVTELDIERVANALEDIADQLDATARRMGKRKETDKP